MVFALRRGFIYRKMRLRRNRETVALSSLALARLLLLLLPGSSCLLVSSDLRLRGREVGVGGGVSRCDISIAKKDRFQRLRTAGQGDVFKVTHPEERFQKDAALVCVVSAPASCKGRDMFLFVVFV